MDHDDDFETYMQNQARAYDSGFRVGKEQGYKEALVSCYAKAISKTKTDYLQLLSDDIEECRND